MLKRHLLPAAILIALAACATACTPAAKVRPTKNVIFMLTDGTSEGALAAARWYQRYMTGDMSFNLSLDQYICGLVQTHESDCPITCSAPGMSAYMTGVLGRIGNVSMNPLPHPGNDFYPVDEDRAGQPAATVLEAARLLKGKSTGLVCTVTFPHATPAAASAHYPYRWTYHPIALQQSCEGLDLLFGSGTDVLTDEMRAMIAGTGATLIEDDVDAFRRFEPSGRKANAANSDRLWALFGGDMTEFEIDRVDSEQPSLSEMTAKAIDMLSRSRKGFFLMVEGSKVDYGAHSKDPVEIITELLEFDRAVKVATDFARKDGNTTVVIVSDHGNAGIQIGGGGYANYEANPVDSIYYGIRGVKASSWKMVQRLQGCAEREIPTVFKEWTGIDLRLAELSDIKKNMNRVEGDYMQVANTWNLQGTIAKIYLSRSNLKLIGGDHTGEDVILGVYNPRGQRPTGVIRNTQLNAYVCQLLGLKGAVSWEDKTLGPNPRNPLFALADEIFAPHDKVFEGLECSVDESGDVPVLRVGAAESGVSLRIPAFHNTVELERPDGSVDVIRTKAPCVWNPDTRKFYLDQSLAGLANGR
ncbi:MAG: alkaline phosphatase [Bacteroidales bacterium]|nr:alkaline phosphatase [Bacteroidales bacterium]